LARLRREIFILSPLSLDARAVNESRAIRNHPLALARQETPVPQLPFMS